MQTQAAGDNGAARSRRTGAEAPSDAGHRRRLEPTGLPTQPGPAAGQPTLTALTDDLHRLAAPLPPGRPIVDASRPSHPSFQGAAGEAELGGPNGQGGVTGSAAAPVFVDSSGQRRKLARRLSIGVVGILGGYVCLIAMSFAGGPIPPGVLLPVPGLPAAKDPAPQPAPAVPAGPSGSAGNGSRTTRPGGLPSGRVVDHTPAHGSQTSASSGAATPIAAPTSALPATPQPSSPATSASSQSHGNPTPPGRVKHSTPAAGPTT